jgi:hypothetical protein
VIDPNNNFILIYFIVNVFATVVLFFLLSVRWGFLFEIDYMPFYEDFKVFCIFLYLFELLIHMNVGYYEMGRKITDRW